MYENLSTSWSQGVCPILHYYLKFYIRDKDCIVNYSCKRIVERVLLNGDLSETTAIVDLNKGINASNGQSISNPPTSPLSPCK